MKLTCQKELLLEIINTVQKAIRPKMSLPILDCIKIDATGDGHIKFTGNCVELCIEYNSQCNVSEGGSIALESKMFGEIVRKLPDGNTVISVNEENFVTKIKCGASEFNIQGMSTNTFPEVPEIEERYSYSVKQSALKRLIRNTIAFVSMNEGKKPIQTGELFEIRNGVLNVVASDGHRLAVVKEPIEGSVENKKVVIPGSTLREMLKILKDEDNEVKITVSERHVLFDFGDFKIYTRILEGEFLKYDAITSAVNTINVSVEKRDIMNCLERALLLINDDNSKPDNRVPVKFSIAYDRIDISCVTGKGQVNDTVPAKIEGDNLLIGFNCRFMLDALSVCDEDVVKLEMSAPTSGCFIRPADGSNSYIYMVLPVRLYN